MDATLVGDFVSTRPPLLAIDLDPDLVRTAYARVDNSVVEGPCCLPHQSLEFLVEKARHQLGHDFQEMVLTVPWGSPRPDTRLCVVRHIVRPVAALMDCPWVGRGVVVVESHSQGWVQSRWRDPEGEGLWELDPSLQPPNQVLVVGACPPYYLTAEHLKGFSAPIRFPESPEWAVVRGAARFALRLCGDSSELKQRSQSPYPG